MADKSNKMTIAKILRDCKLAFVAVFFFSFLSNLMMLATPIAMMQIFQRVLPSQSMPTLIMLVIISMGALVMQIFIDVMRAKAMARVGAKIDRELSEEVFRCHLLTTLTKGSEREVRGLKDLNQFKGFLSSASMYSIMDSLWLPFFIGIFFLIHPVLGGTMLAGALLLLVLAVMTELMTKKPSEEAEEESWRMMKNSRANIDNAEVIMAMGMMPGILNSWKENVRNARTSKLKALDISSFFSVTTRGIQMIFQLLVVSVSAVLIIDHQIHPGAMVAALIMSSRILMPVVMMVSNWQGVISARDAYRRLKKLLEDAPDENAAMELPAPMGRITAEKLTYTPPKASKPIVARVAFEIEPGEVTAVIGATASGKSTIAKLLVGVVKPQLGCVRLDGANIYQWPQDSRGKYVGYLPQNVELFGGTVRENIARMGEQDPEKVVEAARKAGVHEMILQFANGYDTEIGIAGMKLSGGQRQRIGLARALYGSPKLLVLDEPNANLDAEGEAALAKAIMQARKEGTTVVLVSHRKEILKMVDKIIYIKGGRVALSGPRDEILQRMSKTQKAGGPAAVTAKKPAAAIQAKKMAPNAVPNMAAEGAGYDGLMSAEAEVGDEYKVPKSPLAKKDMV